MGKERKHKRRYTLGQPHLTRRRGKAKNWRGWIDGKEISLGTPDRAEALRRLRELAAERRRAQASAPKVEELKLAELTARFVEDGQPPVFTQKTIDTYGGRIMTFVEWAESVDVLYPAQVVPAVLRRYRRYRADEDDVQGRTINRDFTAMNTMFRYGVDNGFVQNNPFANGVMKSLKLREPQPKPQARTLSPAQVDTFLDQADEMAHPAYAALFRGTAGCAARIDEMRHLEAWEIDEVRNVLTISPKPGWTSKSYRYRDIPISQNTVEALKVFVKRRDEVALNDKSVWTALQRVRESTELPPFSMHDLRRAWASAMHDNGASLKKVSVWLGHKDTDTTERYIMVFMDATDGHEFLPR